MTPEEFDEIIKQHSKREEERYKAGWEQARMIAFAAVAPHSKKVRTPSDIIKFPWEGLPDNIGEQEKMTLEERRKLMDKLTKEWS